MPYNQCCKYNLKAVDFMDVNKIKNNNIAIKSFAKMSRTTQIAIALIILSDIVVFGTSVAFEILELHLVYHIIQNSVWLFSSLYFVWSIWIISLLIDKEAGK